MKEIKGYIIDLLEHENRILKKSLTKNKHALKNPYPVEYTVKICSAWEQEGEKDALVKSATIEDGMKKATEKFKAVNNRSDVQGNYFVIAHLRNGLTISIPKKYWGHLQKKVV